jgi:hypothetical protein
MYRQLGEKPNESSSKELIYIQGHRKPKMLIIMLQQVYGLCDLVDQHLMNEKSDHLQI